jgi:signal transduction histidine kinase
VTMRVRDHAGQWRVFEGHLQDQRGDPLIGAYVLNGLDRTREQNLDQRVQDAQQFEALGVLASGLAHDLNNMLLVIASHVEFLGDEDALSPVASRDLAAIRAASDRAQALTQGLLALSRRKSAIRTVIAVEPLIWQRIEARSGVGIRMAEQSGVHSSVRADGTALGHVVDSVLEECVARQTAATRIIRIEERELSVAQAGRLSLEPGSYVVIAAGAELAGAPEQVEDAVKTAEEGEWDLAPSDLSMLMALASVREVGGTVVREREGTAERLAVYLPSVAV